MTECIMRVTLPQTQSSIKNSISQRKSASRMQTLPLLSSGDFNSVHGVINAADRRTCASQTHSSTKSPDWQEFVKTASTTSMTKLIMFTPVITVITRW